MSTPEKNASAVIVTRLQMERLLSRLQSHLVDEHGGIDPLEVNDLDVEHYKQVRDGLVELCEMCGLPVD